MERTTWECTMLAGFGGIMPTLSKFGAALVADPTSPMPAFGFLVGLGIYFLIGSIMSYAFAERNLKQAFLAGIAAPAIIASTISGATGAQSQAPQTRSSASSVPSKGASSLLDILVRPARAQEKGKDSKTGEKPGAPSPQNTVEPVATPKYKYSLSAFPTGSSDWRSSGMNLLITLKDSDGKLLQYTLPSAFDMRSFYSERPLEAVMLETEGFKSSFIPLAVNEGGNIVVRPHIETKKDFFWALGGKGSPVVRDVSAQLVQAQRP